MDHFVDRQQEIIELNNLLKNANGQLLSVYGRRRVGKTTLLLHWVEQTGRPYLYWVARRETAEATRQSLARAIWRWAYPQSTGADVPHFDSWESLFGQLSLLIDDRSLIMIWDEFPYAAENDPSLPSNLQAAWDHQFKNKRLLLILSGSHIGMMVDLAAYHAPLYGRFTGQLPVDPLPFTSLAEFFPGYQVSERIALYATLGGIPAYLERFDAALSLNDNIRKNLFQKTGMFRSEPIVLIGDLIRETRQYESILRAIADGCHTPSEITTTTGISSPNLSPYLKRLRELRLVERRVPATIPLDQRETTTRSRYHVRDAYLRFYFRFIEPNLEMIEMGLTDALWERLKEQFRAFVGLTAFEDICRDRVVAQANLHTLPFFPETVGSYWSVDAQVDVVAANFHEKAILLGECKWGIEAVGRSIVTELFEKASKVVPGPDWKVYFAFFARAGFTEAAFQEAQKANALMVDLSDLDKTLMKAQYKIS